MKTSYDYRASARETLQGQWNETALMSVVLLGIVLLLEVPTSLFSTVNTALEPYCGGGSLLLSVLLVIPLEFALYNVLLMMVRSVLGSETQLSAMWRLFKEDYSRALPAGLLMTIVIVIVSIPTLLIGGIILGYAYKMIPYLIHEYPDLSTREILRLSREMMRGHKWDLFVLEFSFIGWGLLCILTCGIGFLWLIPYMGTAEAHFYEDLKAETIVEE